MSLVQLQTDSRSVLLVSYHPREGSASSHVCCIDGIVFFPAMYSEQFGIDSASFAVEAKAALQALPFSQSRPNFHDTLVALGGQGWLFR